jgi:D-glycero-alpha-D-manno-heptose 1-phosphate guanylyltransferase
LTTPDIAGVLTGYEVPDASRYGTLAVGPHRELLGFKEKQQVAGIINAGMYLFRHRMLGEFPAGSPLSFEQEVFPALAAKGVALRVHLASGPFLDIGTPESLQAAEAFVLSNQTQFAL